MGKLWRRLRFLSRRRRFGDEMEEELRFHLDMKTQDGVDSGLTEEEARYRAQRQFGNTVGIQERSREVWIVTALETLAQDLRYAVRILRKSRGFAGMSIVGLALGIGLSTGIFTLVNAMVRSSQQMKDPATYVLVTHSNNEDFSYSDYAYLRDHNTVLSGLAGWSGKVRLISSGSGDPEEIFGRLISANSFSVFGENPTLGRAFLPEEDRTPGSHPVAILGPAFWQSRFGGDRSIIGKRLTLNGEIFTIVGVAPRNYSHTNNEDVFLPLMMQSRAEPGTDLLGRNSSARWLLMDGRLKDGVSIEQARTELAALENGLREARSKNGAPPAMVLTQGGQNPAKRREQMAAAFAIMLAVGMILLVACANTANLLLARAAARRREIGVRLSLGASRARLIRQLLTESVLLAALGGALGLVLSNWLVRVLVVLAKVSADFDVSPDWRVYAYFVLISLGTGIVFGLAPALEASRPDLASALKAQGATRKRNSLWSFRNSLIVGPLAISLMLLTGAGLIASFLQKNYQRNISTRTERMIAMSFRLDLQGYDETRAVVLHQQLTSRLEKLFGVRSVALTNDLQHSNDGIRDLLMPIHVEGAGATPDEPPSRVAVSIVTPNYFATIGIPIVQGRGFTSDDSSGAPDVAVVNQYMARTYWPGADPIGKQFRIANRPSYTHVIGVVKDIGDDGLSLSQPPFVYVPNLQAGGLRQIPRLKFLILCDVDATTVRKTILPLVRGEARLIDSKLRVSIGTVDELTDSALDPIRTMAILSSGLGSLAMLMAAVGIYGVMAYAVAQRTQEIGVRMALGARKWDVLRLVLNRSVALISIGIVLGLVGAIALTKTLGSFIPGGGGLRVMPFAIVSALLGSVAMLASYVPARRATKVDPMIALRYE